VDESADDGQSYVHGQGQRGLVFCWQGGQQFGQLVAAAAPLFVQRRPPVVGDGYQSGPPVWRTIAFVDSHRSGMIVYKEKNSYGFDTSEVHP
jgi:hypothetical protein